MQHGVTAGYDAAPQQPPRSEVYVHPPVCWACLMAVQQETYLTFALHCGVAYLHDLQRVLCQAQSAAQTSKIVQEQRLAEQESQRDRQAIQDAMYLEQQRAHADARRYRCTFGHRPS